MNRKRAGNGFRQILALLGPGIAVAATGVGAGDMVTAAVAGATYGTALLWAAILGALVKFILNEGIARWQLATGTTLLEGWAIRLHRGVSYYFIVYLILWSIIVAAALISACGLAAYALFGGLSVAWWGIIHSIAAVGLVAFGKYRLFETVMKGFIALMFVVILISAVLIRPDPVHLVSGLILPRFPDEATRFVLGVIGGVGGSVTILSYGYWIRERGWEGKENKFKINLDLGVAYFLTGLFGAAIMVVAAGTNPQLVTGNQMAIEVANRLQAVVGPAGRWIFLFGFWGAVFSSMIGVWQGVPYLFADFMQLRQKQQPGPVSTSSRYYRLFLLFLAFPPMLILLFGRPVWVVITYSITGALFMPFLALTLLYMNNQAKWVGSLKNRWSINILLLLSLMLFAYLGVNQFLQALK